MKEHFQKQTLRRCNELALRALGRTAINPNVGALIVNHDENRILGEGWHKELGGPHAEVNAINNATKKHSLSGKTIAVSLEPCNHIGKTPACTSAIVDHKLSEVWVDQIDPNERMKGQSIALLRTREITVPAPSQMAIGNEVIRPFNILIRHKRPFLRLKMALSQDFFIGKYGSQIKISGQISDRWVHRIRSETQAIMAGTNTILNDNPSLTSRYENRNQPVRILPDRKGILPGDLNVFSIPGQNIIMTTSNRRDYPGEIININPHDLGNALHMLYRHNIGSILVEGGKKLFTSLLEEGLWDELILIQNNILTLREGIQAPEFPRVEPEREIKLGNDTLIFIKNPASR